MKRGKGRRKGEDGGDQDRRARDQLLDGDTHTHAKSVGLALVLLATGKEQRARSLTHLLAD